MRCSTYLTIALAMIPGILVLTAAAQEEGAPQQLKPLVVEGAIENSATGRSRISRDVIPHLRRGNGNISELLEILPDVHLDRSFSNSLTGGEILPPEVSISGGKFYQNNFTLDGMGNNSLLDPTQKNVDAITDVPGHSQELFLDSALVESISVYDSNVPARYGHFTGGVVDVVTRNPGPDFGGRVSFRHTRDDWTQFHLGDEDQFDFSEGRSPSRQPRFEKNDVGLELNLPLGEKQGVLASYRFLHSDIPLYNLDRTQEQSRILHNIFIKYQNLLSDSTVLELSLKATPYEGEHFIANARDSRFLVKGGGYSLGAALYKAFSDWELTLRGGYQLSENSREAPNVWRPWRTLGSTTWGSTVNSEASLEGGFGDIEKEQHTLHLATQLSSYPQRTDWGSHQWHTGLDFEHIRGRYERTETAYIYREPFFSDTVICGDDLIGCVEGEQFFSRRNIYPETSARASMTRLAAHAENQIRVGNFGLRPGLRLSYDDFMENFNVAPRLAATWDVFGDQRTRLIAGLNRYYGQTLLTYKLREAIAPYQPQERGLQAPLPTLDEWSDASRNLSQVSRFSSLDTPYSDEIAAGVDQQLLGGRLSLKFVYREGKDEFARRYGDLEETGLRPYTLSNDGRSRHRSWRATWERSWEKHFLSVNANWRRSETNHQDFDASVIEDEETESRIWYRDQLIFRDQLPDDADDFPVEMRLTWIAKLPWGLTFTNFTTFRSSYDRIVDTLRQQELPPTEKDDPEQAQTVPVYADRREASSWRFDWKLSWEREVYQAQRIRLHLEVNNVFNEKISTEPALLQYETGRQFWAGVDYLF